MKKNKLTTVFTALIICIILSSNVYGQWTQKGQDVDGGIADDRFGYAVSLSFDGNTMAAGAPCSGSVFADPGHARVFDWNVTNSSWDQKGDDINGESNGDRFGHSVSLSADGNTLAIGSPANNSSGQQAGVIRIYEWDADSNSWGQKGLDIDGETDGGNFGWSVCISDDGNTLIGGARYNSALGWGTGHARVYRWNDNDGAWEQMGEDLDGETAGSNAGFATSINTDGNIVAVGSPYHIGIGYVKAYAWNAGTNAWDQIGTTLSGDLNDENYGYTVCLSDNGHILAIGSKGDCLIGQNAGHTRIYELNEVSDSWEQMGEAINGESAWDLSGFTVALNGLGTMVAVGSPFNDAAGAGSGHTRVFDWDGATSDWVQKGIDIDGEAADDHSGWSVCLSSDGNTIVSGANANDGNGLSAGHARVFEFQSTVGISSLENELRANIFPNPANGTVRIDLIVDGEVSVGLYDVTGRSVFNKRVWSNGTHIELNIENLASGTYKAIIDTPEGRYTSTLIKN